MLVEELGVEDVELVALDSLGRWIVVVIVLGVVLVPLDGGSPPVYVLRLLVPETSLTLTRYPIVELLLVILQPLVLLELDDLLRDEVDRHCRVVDYRSAQQFVVLRQRQVVIEALTPLLELILEDPFRDGQSLSHLLLLRSDQSMIDSRHWTKQR